MSNTAIIELVAASAAVFGLAAFVGLIALPAMQAYGRAWQRVAAGFLSLYVLAAFVGIGLAAGALVVYEWDRLF